MVMDNNNKKLIKLETLRIIKREARSIDKNLKRSA